LRKTLLADLFSISTTTICTCGRTLSGKTPQARQWIIAPALATFQKNVVGNRARERNGYRADFAAPKKVRKIAESGSAIKTQSPRETLGAQGVPRDWRAQQSP